MTDNSGSCLVVDDDPTVAAVVVGVLRQDGFEVEHVTSGEEAVQRCRANEPDVVLLDLELGGINGQQTCRLIREFSDTYIIMLTGRDSEIDRVLSLSLGADDYILKPFSAAELVARVRALMRRSRRLVQQQEASAVDAESHAVELRLDAQTRSVTVNSIPLDLTTLQFDVLAALVEASPEPLSRAHLIQAGWGDDWVGDDHMIDVHISAIRRRLHEGGATTTRLLNVRGFGFRIVTGATHSGSFANN